MDAIMEHGKLATGERQAWFDPGAIGACFYNGGPITSVTLTKLECLLNLHGVGALPASNGISKRGPAAPSGTFSLSFSPRESTHSPTNRPSHSFETKVRLATRSHHTHFKSIIAN